MCRLGVGWVRLRLVQLAAQQLTAVAQFWFGKYTGSIMRAPSHAIDHPPE
jgi:hypothetical protein